MVAVSVYGAGKQKNIESKKPFQKYGQKLQRGEEELNEKLNRPLIFYQSVKILRTDTAYILAKFATMGTFNRAFKSGDADASPWNFWSRRGRLGNEQNSQSCWSGRNFLETS